MQDYKRAIAELHKTIEKDSAQVRTKLRKLGEHLSYKGADLLPDPAMKELHDRIQELRRELPDSRQQVKKILQTVAGNEALEREIRTRKLQIDELSRKNQQICESIGRAAYEAYKKLPVSGKTHRELFEPLDKQEQELAGLEEEQEALQDHGREGKFFKIFRETGRSVYLKGLLSLRRKAIVKTYNEIGRRICGSPEIKQELEDRKLQETLAPYEANERSMDTLQQELSELLGDQEKKWNDLKDLGAHRSHQKRVREIESEIQRIETKLQDTFEGLGSQFRNMHPEKLQDSEAAGFIHQIKGIEADIRRKKKRIERLNAALQIEGLRHRLANLADRVSRLKGEIESRSLEIETLRTQIEVGEKEIQRLQRIRGSEQALLEGEGG
jgi:chromosome segregation ATPase